MAKLVAVHQVYGTGTEWPTIVIDDDQEVVGATTSRSSLHNILTLVTVKQLPKTKVTTTIPRAKRGNTSRRSRKG